MELRGVVSDYQSQKMVRERAQRDAHRMKGIITSQERQVSRAVTIYKSQLIHYRSLSLSFTLSLPDISAQCQGGCSLSISRGERAGSVPNQRATHAVAGGAYESSPASQGF